MLPPGLRAFRPVHSFHHLLEGPSSFYLWSPALRSQVIFCLKLVLVQQLLWFLLRKGTWEVLFVRLSTSLQKCLYLLALTLNTILSCISFLRALKALLVHYLAVLLLGIRTLFWLLILHYALLYSLQQFSGFSQSKCLHIPQRLVWVSVAIIC